MCCLNQCFHIEVFNKIIYFFRMLETKNVIISVEKNKQYFFINLTKMLPKYEHEIRKKIKINFFKVINFFRDYF